MHYPGDPGLAVEIRSRVLTTFRQTLELAEEGRLQEASLGCDFILKMDPRFEPARRLQERLAVASGPISTADLEPGANPPAATSFPATQAPPSLDDLSTVQFAPQDLSLSLADQGVDLGALFQGQPSASPPAPPPLPGAAGGAAPDVASPGGASSRIGELLAEGQRAFDAGEYQNAVDAWSRIFLIDVDHPEANRRIEAARKLKAEQERVVDEQLHEGARALDEGRTDEAREIFERLLAQDPGNVAARDYLARVGGVGVSEERHTPPPAGDLYGEPPPPLPDTFAGAADDAPRAEPPETPVPAPAGSAYGGSAQRQARVARGDRRLLWIGAAGLATVLAAGYFLVSNWRSLFPRTEEAQPAPVARASAIEEAMRLHLAGDVTGAIERLERVGEKSQDRARAEELIAQWRAEAAAAAPKDGEQATAEARNAEQAAHVARARRAYDEREYLRAVKAFRTAEQLGPLEAPAAELYQDAKRQLVPLAAQLDLFQQREWERVLPMLWRQHVDDETNRDVRRLLVDTLFNLGLRSMRDGDDEGAVENFRDVVRLAPEDTLAQKLLLFAESFQGSVNDLVFQILAGEVEYRS